MISFVKKLFKQQQVEEKSIMKKFLIVGLGNIGAEYENTRHNIGFKILDYFAKEESLTFTTQKLGDIATHKYKGKAIIFLKPSTYMNLSGKAVKYWMDKEKISLENILIITDDLNLPFDTIRLKGKGSHGGHNGLKDIQEKFGTSNYVRLRFGVGNNFSKGKQVDYVLGEWSNEEELILHEKLKTMSEVIKSFVSSGLSNTMNNYNGAQDS
jgi:PTH1 family peptidyl-tRNA hydrolase